MLQFITGPAVLKTVTSEVCTMEELGGCDTHTKLSGVSFHSITVPPLATNLLIEFFGRVRCGHACFSRWMDRASQLPIDSSCAPVQGASLACHDDVEALHTLRRLFDFLPLSNKAWKNADSITLAWFSRIYCTPVRL